MPHALRSLRTNIDCSLAAARSGLAVNFSTTTWLASCAAAAANSMGWAGCGTRLAARNPDAQAISCQMKPPRCLYAVYTCALVRIQLSQSLAGRATHLDTLCDREITGSQRVQRRSEGCRNYAGWLTCFVKVGATLAPREYSLLQLHLKHRVQSLTQQSDTMINCGARATALNRRTLEAPSAATARCADSSVDATMSLFGLPYSRAAACSKPDAPPAPAPAPPAPAVAKFPCTILSSELCLVMVLVDSDLATGRGARLGDVGWRLRDEPVRDAPVKLRLEPPTLTDREEMPRSRVATNTSWDGTTSRFMAPVLAALRTHSSLVTWYQSESEAGLRPWEQRNCASCVPNLDARLVCVQSWNTGPYPTYGLAHALARHEYFQGFRQLNQFGEVQDIRAHAHPQLTELMFNSVNSAFRFLKARHRTVSALVKHAVEIPRCGASEHIVMPCLVYE